MGSEQPIEEEKDALAEACRALILRQRAGGPRAPELDDVTQEACVKALELSEPQLVREPLRYLSRIARNLFIDRRRKEQRNALFLDHLGVMDPAPALVADPERVLAGKQELQRALAAIGELPPRCREAFTLHRFGGLSYTAIARRMNVSNGTVEKHIAEAMLRIARACRKPKDEP